MMLYISAMFLTAIIETIVFRLCGYKKFYVLACFFIINLISNFLINVFYQNFYYIAPKTFLIVTLELFVVLFEFVFMGLFLKYSQKMFIYIFLTNVLSFLIGLSLFGI